MHQIWTTRHPIRGLDVYVRTIGKRPFHEFAHYWVDINEPERWWAARSYTYEGVLAMPDHMVVVPGASM